MFTPPPERHQRCRVLYVSPLKALAVDVERNLRAPLVGIANLAAARGEPYQDVPAVAVRTGDTPALERARLARTPADIVITTPESLYLLLTSNAREILRSVETVIVDEIHALVPTKRGAHLALSLERLEALTGRPLQRIGLSATQRPLEEVARFLGGVQGRTATVVAAASVSNGDGGRAALAGETDGVVDPEFADSHDRLEYRPVTVVDAGSRKPLSLTVEVPVEDMARLGEPIDIPSGPASQGPVRASIWSAIHPRLLELIQAHRSTLLFVNSRRVAERLAGALNELAGEVLALAHHGSLARAQRIEIEDRLKSGRVRALVATSPLELAATLATYGAQGFAPVRGRMAAPSRVSGQAREAAASRRRAASREQWPASTAPAPRARRRPATRALPGRRNLPAAGIEPGLPQLVVAAVPPRQVTRSTDRP